MKKLFCFACATASINISIAQMNTGFQNDISNIGRSSGANGTTLNHDGQITSSSSHAQTLSGITAFSNSTVKGTRYLYDTWTNGSVTDIKNNVYALNYTFNFDKINQDVYAKYQGNNNVTVVLDRSQIKRVLIGSVNFINSDLLRSKAKNVFYEVLVEDSNRISLFKLLTTRFEKASSNDVMKARTGDYSSEYIDDIKYYVSIKGGELQKVNLIQNNIRKVLKDKSDKVDAYFNQSSTNDLDESSLKQLVQYLNQ